MESNVVTIDDANPARKVSYYLNSRLRRTLDKKVRPSINKNDKDYIIVVDGNEGAGKSWFAMQMGRYIDPTLDLNRIVFSAEEFKEAVFKAKKGQCIIYDEAFTGLSSRSSLSGINRYLVSLMMQMRQKNLFVIVVLPTYFMLDKYVALFRTNFLCHIYETGGRRGYFKLFNRKNKRLLYIMGKKLMTYPVKTRFKGRFYGNFALGDKIAEKKYRIKKDKALEETHSNPMTSAQVKYRDQRDILIWLLKKETKQSWDMLAEVLTYHGIEISTRQMRRIFDKNEILDDKKDISLGQTTKSLGNDTEDDGNSAESA